MKTIQGDFSAPPGEPWQRHLPPGSRIEAHGGAWRFSNQPADGSRYTNAQIDDYQNLPRRAFRWQPPLSLRVRARFSANADGLHGTAGFGFWNDPFAMTGGRLPALPRAIWFFFASAPSDLPLDMQTPGRGWKAAMIDALRLPFFLLAPTAPLAVPLMNIRALYRTLWPVGQRAVGVREATLELDMTVWHDYELHWGRRYARFLVDGSPVLEADDAPGGRLGFVMWIDNQAMIATPWGRFAWRTLPLPQEQWMEVAGLEIQAG